MKLYVTLLSATILLLLGCNNDTTHQKPATQDRQISEATLPKGKYIFDDEKGITTIPIDTAGSLNGFNTGNTNPKNTGAAVEKIKEEVLMRRYKNLLVFHVDDTMKIKQAYIAKLILGKDQVLSSLEAEVLETTGNNGENIKYDSTVEIGTKMRVKLKDVNATSNKGFDIEFLGEEEAYSD